MGLSQCTAEPDVQVMFGQYIPFFLILQLLFQTGNRRHNNSHREIG